ncbi:unnamed protein product [Linum tenue]|uniref:Cytochrome P450 n=1 Tax=Linum tenue TaxID=586396 RepID=A0AAV0P3M4_9ROSI|nr:unnamed protein product [Linum tenue]
MDFFPPFLKTITIATVLVLLVLSYPLFFRRPKSRTGKQLPEAGRSWPVIGHLLSLAGTQLPHLKFAELAAKYGPIFIVRIGLYPTLVVTTSELAKELYTTHDASISSRPDLTASRILSNNRADFAFTPYGDYWRQMRKITALELLSSRRLELLKHVRISEVEGTIRSLHKLWEKNDKDRVCVQMNKWFGDMNLNVILGMVAGHEKTMRRVNGDLNKLAEEWIEEHRSKRTTSCDDDDEQEEDFIDVLLRVLKDADLAGYDLDTVCKSTIMERVVDESEICKLPYFQAMMKEVMRLYPAAPSGGPREFSKDCIVAGYHVPAGTRLLVNVHNVQRDPRVWPEPMEFKPERFLAARYEDVDVKGQHFELIPFGAGRRSCPGINFGIQMTQLALARFLQAFDIYKPSDAPVDMTGAPGLTVSKAIPLEVLVRPRLSVYLYEQTKNA